MIPGGGGGGNPASFLNPSIDGNSVISNKVTSTGTFVGNTTPGTSLLGIAGPFVNEGSIIANGPTGGSFTVAVSDTKVAGTLERGYFINYNNIEVDAGNVMTITVGAGSEFFNVGEISVKGGSLRFSAAAGAIDGGYAGGSGAVVITGGGAFETNAGYSATSVSSVPIYAFADSHTGNTLKIDNIGSFGCAILGFGENETIDLGTAIAVGKIAFNNTTGILNLFGNGSITASLLFGSGNFLNGTTTVAGGVAGSFSIGTGADGNTVLTTNVRNNVFTNNSGSWQTAGLWPNGTPGTMDTAFIGIAAQTPSR